MTRTTPKFVIQHMQWPIQYFSTSVLLNIPWNLLILQSASQHNNLTCKTIIQFARSSSAVAEGFQQNNIETIIVNMHITNVKITKLHSNNGLKTEAGFGVLFFAGGKQSDKMNYIYTPPPSEHLSWITKIFKFQMRERNIFLTVFLWHVGILYHWVLQLY